MEFVGCTPTSCRPSLGRDWKAPRGPPPASFRLRGRARLVTAIVRGVTVSVAVLAAFLFTGRMTPATLAGLLCLLLLQQRDTLTLLVGLLLLAHAALAARTWSQPRLLTGLASGGALGARRSAG